MRNLQYGESIHILPIAERFNKSAEASRDLDYLASRDSQLHLFQALSSTAAYYLEGREGVAVQFQSGTGY